MRESDDFDVRLPHPIEPWTKSIVATAALERAAEDTLVTVVPVDHQGEAARLS